MKNFISFILPLFLPAIIFAQDTTFYKGRAGIADVADSDPGLFIFMMMILTGFIVATLTGLLITALSGLLLIVLTAGGIVSVSLLFEFYRRSFYSGFKTFIYTSFITVGVSGTITVFLLINALSTTHFVVNYYVLFATITSGIAGSLISGRLFLIALNKTYHYVRGMLKLTNTES